MDEHGGEFEASNQTIRPGVSGECGLNELGFVLAGPSIQFKVKIDSGFAFFCLNIA
jgi:hypothetical protein